MMHGFPAADEVADPIPFLNAMLAQVDKQLTTSTFFEEQIVSERNRLVIGLLGELLKVAKNRPRRRSKQEFERISSGYKELTLNPSKR